MDDEFPDAAVGTKPAGLEVMVKFGFEGVGDKF
jgi:hypothetical protein